MKTCLELQITAFLISSFALAASAQQSAPVPSVAPASTNQLAADQVTSNTMLPEVVVTGHSYDVGQSTIDPSLGIRAYTIGTAQIQTMPQGADTTFAEVVERSPGVSQDAYGSWHVRGEDTGTSYLLNGIPIPLGIVNSIFGQKFDTRFISSVSLLDGALPAQYGLNTGGIFDIKTKQGSELEGGVASIYGGSYDTMRENFSYGGVYSNIDYWLRQQKLWVNSSGSGSRPNVWYKAISIAS